MRYRILFVYFFAVVMGSCQNTKEEFTTDKITDFIPLQVGKYITYRLDSTVFTLSGSKIEVHKYQVKHIIHSEISDNEGRKTFLVHRLINNETGSGPWLENGTYTITPLSDRIEILENSLRVVTLRMPMKQGFTWKGNSYLPVSPYRDLFEMTGAGITLNQWNFDYRNYGDTTVQGQQYKDVWTVVQSENQQNIPPEPINSYGEMEVSSEKFARNIGLVYKNFQLYEHQPINGNDHQPYYAGFGITMWMINHN